MVSQVLTIYTACLLLFLSGGSSISLRQAVVEVPASVPGSALYPRSARDGSGVGSSGLPSAMESVPASVDSMGSVPMGGLPPPLPRPGVPQSRGAGRYYASVGPPRPQIPGSGPRNVVGGKRIVKPGQRLQFPQPIFTPHGQRELCNTVIEELQEVDLTLYMATYNVWSMLQFTAHDEQGETLMSDKQCDISLSTIHKQQISAGFMEFIPRLVMCDADSSLGLTMFQAMIFYGMRNSVKNEFTMHTLAGGTADYHPELDLDFRNNTLMHLAVISNVFDMVEVMIKTVGERYKHSPNTQFSVVYWTVTALNRKNAAGERPLDLAKAHGVKSTLKRRFRVEALFLENKMKDYRAQGLLSSATVVNLERNLNEVRQDLRSATSIIGGKIE